MIDAKLIVNASHLSDAAVSPSHGDEVLTADTLVEEADGTNARGVDLEGLERRTRACGGVPVRNDTKKYRYFVCIISMELLTDVQLST